MRQHWIVFALIITAAFFLACLALPINFPWRTRAVAASDGHCMPSGATCIALNPGVTAETIGGTICTAGYTEHLRPDADYVSDIKIKLGRKVGISPDVARAMVLDHIIPLSLGGHPRDESNLQLQDATESRLKNNVEKWLHDLVCSRLASLDKARAAIAKDWRTAERQF